MKIYTALLWFACGLASAGLDNAYFQRKWCYPHEGRQDLGRSLILVPGGPISLAIEFFLNGMGEYGWSLSANAQTGYCDTAR
jgi:hypothetical protein